jgi:hypothetical protein
LYPINFGQNRSIYRSAKKIASPWKRSETRFVLSCYSGWNISGLHFGGVPGFSPSLQNGSNGGFDAPLLAMISRGGMLAIAAKTND